MKVLWMLLCFLLLAINSCNYLDVSEYFAKHNTTDSVWNSPQNIMAFMWSQVSYLPNESNVFFGYTSLTFASDEGFLSGKNATNPNQYIFGEITAHNFGDNNWRNCYIVIRNCNQIFQNSNKANLSAAQEKELHAYTRFLRAYAYHHLIMYYGPVVLLGDEVVNNNALPNEYATYFRSPLDECIDYVYSEMEKAAADMPLRQNLAQLLFGRPHKHAVWAIMARLRLHGASQAFNGPRARELFSSFVRKQDGVPYISQAAQSDTKWALAAMTAKRLIDLGQYQLFRAPRDDSRERQRPYFPANFDGDMSHDPYLSYANIFNGIEKPEFNKEIIWGMAPQYSTMNVGLAELSFPVGATQLGGRGRGAVTYKVIRSYRKNDGTPFPEITLAPEDPTRKSTRESFFSGYWLKAGVDTLFRGREMRFYASIGFNRCNWPVLSITPKLGDDKSKSIGNNLTVIYEYGAGSKQGEVAGGKNIALSTSVEDCTYTGFVSKKWIHPDDAVGGNSEQRPGAEVNFNKSFPIIRYAEILLIYVEALNNIRSPQTLNDPITGITHTFQRDWGEMAKYFKDVRNRVGLPGIAVDPGVEGMNLEIREERMKEFFNEGRRYFDLRRWGILEEEESVPIQGMDIDAGSEGFHKVVRTKHPYATGRESLPNKRRFYFAPIAVNELRKATGIDQNPGWEQ